LDTKRRRVRGLTDFLCRKPVIRRLNRISELLEHLVDASCRKCKSRKAVLRGKVNGPRRVAVVWFSCVILGNGRRCMHGAACHRERTVGRSGIKPGTGCYVACTRSRCPAIQRGWLRLAGEHHGQTAPRAARPSTPMQASLICCRRANRFLGRSGYVKSLLID
jgi:hypothetical protein